MRDDLPVPGDLIWIRRRQWRVRSARMGDGLSQVLVDGWPAAEPRTFLLPCDRWTRDAPRHTRLVSCRRAMAWLAGCVARAHRSAVPSSIVQSRAGLLAYQLEPALAILAGRRRILIADDVGLGKTVQAAMIIAEILQRRADARVLVMAPASLLTQWADELLSRFGISAQAADAEAFARLRAERVYLANPWDGPGVWLVSPDYLKQPHVIEGMPRAPFDLVVIDEAHAMSGLSQRHSAVDGIARRAGQVVLLTATPHDGDERRFRRLVSLGSTDSAGDRLTIFRRARPCRTRHVRNLMVSPGPALSKVLSALEAFARTSPSAASDEGLMLICAVFRKRALSSMAALRASLTRRLAIVNAAPRVDPADSWVQPRLGFEDEADQDGDVISADEQSVLRGATGLPADRERAWLQRLLALATGSRSDPKLERLISLLRRTREPAVIFTEYRDSLSALAEGITGVRRLAILHGGLAGSEQRAALSGFLGGGADALLATDVASQGLNLQHRARWVVHFDLPWTPMRLEQRVGRVDRIGQKHRVHVTTIRLRHAAEETLRQRLVARQDIGDAAALLNCTRWTNAGAGLAQWFARQRVMAARWRGPDPITVPRARIRPPALRSLGLPDTERVTLVEIPLVTGTGEVIERHLGWIAGDADDRLPPGHPPPALVRRARALGNRERRRLMRLQAAQTSNHHRVPEQAGLFEARAVFGPREDVPAGEPRGPEVVVHIGQPRSLVVLERRP